jgi:xanthine dehydrogenase accessory factor
MKDVQTVLKAYREQVAAGASFALATIVSVEGSAYRRPGARMLITPDGRRFGSLSGGCLEADVAVHAQNALATGKPTMLTYAPDQANGDIIIETGCKGAIGILVEPATIPDVALSLEVLASVVEARLPARFATVCEVRGIDAVRVGDRLIVSPAAPAHGALAASPLYDSINTDLAALSADGASRSVSYPLAQGVARVLLEALPPPIALLLCGSGHDTLPLSRIAAALGWHVTVADTNGAELTADRYPDARALLPIRPECLTAHLTPDARTVAVLMTHRYAADLAWFRHLLPTPLRYLGVLGPRRRWERMHDELVAEGGALSERDFERVHSPAGLDIGSETPEEIALAIVAEIQTVMNRRHGGFLRHRAAPLHLPTADPTLLLPDALAQGFACPLSES